jgi:hypothetical protein
LILTRTKNNTRGRRIGGVLTECIALKMAVFTEYEGEYDDELPDF